MTSTNRLFMSKLAESTQLNEYHRILKFRALECYTYRGIWLCDMEHDRDAIMRFDMDRDTYR